MALMRCPECGKEISSQAGKCPNCGYPLFGSTRVPVNDLPSDIPSTGLNVLAFCIPLVGLILYCVNLGQYPRKAQAIGKWALIGFIVWFICTIFLTFI